MSSPLWLELDTPANDRPNSDPADDQLQHALRSIRRHLGMDVAFVSQFAHGQRTFRYVDSDSAFDGIAEGVSTQLDATYCNRVVKGEIAEMSGNADVGSLPPDPILTRALEIRSYLSVPIKLSDGSLYGTFCVASRTADQSLNVRDLNAVRAFADMAAAQIEQRQKSARARRNVARRIQAVLDSDDALTIVYQPIVDITRNDVVGFESLSRFSAEPYRTPDIWFAEAAEVALDAQLEVRAIEKALAGLSLARAGTYISVNASPIGVMRGDFDRVLRSVPGERIVLELTEHAVISDYTAVNRACDALRADGIRIAIDDAGSGYASFRHILALQPDFIKLDMTLTRGIDRDTSRQALTAAFVAFAANTSCEIIAEGIETETALAKIRELGVTKAQGYLFGAPAAL
jgi:EAL domain-containing protein (putative c-di-GMP-specific phosphodiesterase class I)